MPNYYGESVTNNSDLYDELFEKRGVENISQYKTVVIGNMVNKDSSYFLHYWRQGDRLYKLAGRYYGSTTEWWKIALFNGIGAEVDIKIGDAIKIPVEG